MQLLGLLLPPLIDLINRDIKDTDTRFWVSVLVCVLAGSVIQLIQDHFVFIVTSPYETTILSVFGLAQLAYKGIYEKSKLQTTIRNDTTSTSIDLPELPKI